MTAKEIANLLKTASVGLLLISESDYPFEVVVWSGAGAVTAQNILQQIEKPPETLVKEVDLDSFFQKVTQEQDWYGDEEKANVTKYRNLAQVIKSNLADVKVFRIGEIEIDIYIIGKVDADLVGLKTQVVET